MSLDSEVPHRDPIVRFYGVGPESLWDLDWSSFTIPPPIRLHQLHIAFPLADSTKQLLAHDLLNLKNKIATGAVEGVSIISYSKHWATFAAKFVHEARYVEIRFLDKEAHTETSLIYDRRGSTTIRGSFVSMPADRVPNFEELPESFRSAHGPRIVRIEPPISSRFLSVSDAAAKNVLVLLKSRCQLQKCTIPLDLFSNLEELFEFLRRNLSCDELEFSEPASFNFLKLGDMIRSNYLRTFVHGIQHLVHLRILVIPIIIINPTVMACISTLPLLEILRIRPSHHLEGGSIAQVRNAVVIARSRFPSGFKSLKLLDIGAHEPTDFDTELLPEIYNLFPHTTIYQTLTNQRRLPMEHYFPGTDVDRVSMRCLDICGEWGWNTHS